MLFIVVHCKVSASVSFYYHFNERFSLRVVTHISLLHFTFVFVICAVKCNSAGTLKYANTNELNWLCIDVNSITQSISYSHYLAMARQWLGKKIVRSNFISMWNMLAQTRLKLSGCRAMFVSATTSPVNTVVVAGRTVCQPPHPLTILYLFCIEIEPMWLVISLIIFPCLFIIEF